MIEPAPNERATTPVARLLFSGRVDAFFIALRNSPIRKHSEIPIRCFRGASGSLNGNAGNLANLGNLEIHLAEKSSRKNYD